MKNLILYLALFIFGASFITISNAGSNLMHSNNIQPADSIQTCIVTGEEFIQGSGVNIQYLNREFSVCCEGCVKKFKKEPASYIKDGLRCPVCDDDDGKKDLSHVHDGVKYYFCASGCKTKFENEPQKYLDNYRK